MLKLLVDTGFNKDQLCNQNLFNCPAVSGVNVSCVVKPFLKKISNIQDIRF